MALDLYAEPERRQEVFFQNSLDPQKAYFPGYGYVFHFEKAQKETSSADPSVHRVKRKDETDDGSFNPSFLTRWITAFRESHDLDCSMKSEYSSISEMPGFKLVDVHEMRVVDALPDTKYLALSYIWGPRRSWLEINIANANILCGPRGLLKFEEELPRTVWDAIILTGLLNYQYLWVDRFCVIQDDPVHRSTQIGFMGTIFQGAQLVLAAAYGYDADAGLPGAEGGRYPLRGVRRREYIHKNVRLLSVDQQISMFLGRSVWNTRGWIMQESVLSPLKLIFTPNQAYLLCRCGVCSPETHALDVFHFNQDKIKTTLSQRTHQNMQYVDHCLLNEYAGYLKMYTTCNLSNPEDILDAFRAILAELGEKWGTSFLFGLPRQALGPALVWAPWGDPTTIRRRHCEITSTEAGRVIKTPVPSWSWIGWSGPLYLAANLHGEGTGCVYEETKYDARYLLETPVTQSNGDLAMKFHALRLEAWTATFQVDKLESEDASKSRHKYPGFPIIQKETGEIISHVGISMDVEWPRQEAVDSCEFIAIIARPRLGFRRGYKYTSYMHDETSDIVEGSPEIVDVMLISCDDQTGEASRVGIAGIRFDDWEAANPVKKIVTLV